LRFPGKFSLIIRIVDAIQAKIAQRRCRDASLAATTSALIASLLEDGDQTLDYVISSEHGRRHLPGVPFFLKNFLRDYNCFGPGRDFHGFEKFYFECH